MKANSTQQEILLMTGTRFSSRQCSDKNDATAHQNLNEKERLEEACWNGMIKDMLPEICDKNSEDKQLYLWQIKEGESYIELELAEFPEEKDKYFSIDPYALMSVQYFS